MRMGIMLLCVGLSGCAHRSGPDDLKGQPLQVCESPGHGPVSCDSVGGHYRRAMQVARADFARWLEALPEDSPDARPEFEQCIREPSNYGLSINILDEDIQVVFFPVKNCLAPDEVGTGLGMTYTLQRPDMRILAREPHE
ncbi:MAG TPA: hypothetical protein VE153_19630 [Myxococcus sp.]|nr:hypothetical protein [Myxococcus sp.]